MNIQYTRHDMTEEDIASAEKALRSGILTNGGCLTAFEQAFAGYVQSPYALGVSSGTAGLHLAVLAMDAPRGRTVLVPSLTFAATANAALYCGLRVEFVDIDPETLLMDISSIEAKVREHPDTYAGVIATDFAGYPLDTEELSTICKRYGLWLIEDAAHALGAVSNWHGESVKVGSSTYADVTVFSFHPAKHITTGEGGMVTTRSEQLYRRMKLLRSHAMDKDNEQSAKEPWHYRLEHLGYNYRLSEINAALGLSQLRRIEGSLQKRQAIAERYRSELGGALTLPSYDAENFHAYHLFIIQTPQRHALYDHLNQQGIHPQIHYVPLHLQPYYQGLVGDVTLPYTEKYYEGCLSIPMYPSLTAEEQSYVIRTIKTFKG